MKRFSIRMIVNLAQLLLVFVPVTISCIMLLVNPSGALRSLKVVLPITFGLTIFTIIIQNIMLGGFQEGIRRIIGKLELVEQGDLTVSIEERSIGELNELSSTTGKVVKEFGEMVSDVYLSTSEVTHLINTVTETS
ncbi:MAG: hypothetical protein Q8930_12610, partial [Bacillota bacterium]|nr:hypothetical protein [Bacillota bacterium]